MTQPALSETQVESQIKALFLRAGWFPVKTEAGMVARGGRPGHLPAGYPDLTMLRALPGTDLCLAALIETKTASGRVRASQVKCHADLQAQYGIRAHIVRDPQQAVHLITQARRIVSALKGVSL